MRQITDITTPQPDTAPSPIDLCCARVTKPATKPAFLAAAQAVMLHQSPHPDPRDPTAAHRPETRRTPPGWWIAPAALGGAAVWAGIIIAVQRAF